MSDCRPILSPIALAPLCVALCMAWASHAQQPPQTMVLDRVVAVVNNRAILASDLDDELRLSVLDPGQAGLGKFTRQRALEQLISRALIEQQIREGDAQLIEPTQAEVASTLVEIRRELPACIRNNCASDDGWKAFLAAHELSPLQVEGYLRHRMEILSFIELRFRQGIQIAPEEIDNYYHQTLLPQYSKGEAVPSLDKVASRIEEILLQRKVNVLFDDWLTNLRKQGEVEVLDPTLEPAVKAAPATDGKASQ
jgi:hypothetical protein